MIDLLSRDNSISPEAKDLILGLVKYNPVERLSASDALKSDWFDINAPL